MSLSNFHKTKYVVMVMEMEKKKTEHKCNCIEPFEELSSSRYILYHAVLSGSRIISY